MPKMKSKSGAKKRFRVTGSGRIKRKRAYHRHCFSAKSGKRGRRLRKGVMLDKSNLGQVEIMLLV